MRLIPAVLILALTGCAGLREQINCSNGARLRAAALDTIQAIDKACPIIREGN